MFRYIWRGSRSLILRVSGYILAWTQPLKNRQDQNSFSEKHKNTVFLVTLAITTSDTNTTIRGRV